MIEDQMLTYLSSNSGRKWQQNRLKINQIYIALINLNIKGLRCSVSVCHISWMSLSFSFQNCHDLKLIFPWIEKTVGWVAPEIMRDIQKVFFPTFLCKLFVKKYDNIIYILTWSIPKSWRATKGFYFDVSKEIMYIIISITASNPVHFRWIETVLKIHVSYLVYKKNKLLY